VDGALKHATSVTQLLAETLPFVPPEVRTRRPPAAAAATAGTICVPAAFALMQFERTHGFKSAKTVASQTL